MRTVEANWYRDFLYNLGLTKGRYDTAISQASSGKRLNHLSDDPPDMAYALNLRSKIDQVDQFGDNIQSGLAYLNSAESAINAVQNVMYSVITLAEDGASESTGAEGRRTIADQIDLIRDEILNYANTEVMGKFIFAGSATDTQPFVKAADTIDPVSGVTIPGVVTYQGNTDTIEIQADFSVTVGTNIPGGQVFGDSTVAAPPYDIFQRLSDLIEALREDDTTAIGNEIGNMNELTNQLGESMGIIGNRTSHLNQIKGLLSSFRASLQAKMSSLEDADMAETISNLGREEVALQATLQAGSRIQRFSLMNYLG
jgi:flagellar hook-associated protein 3 FlgL